MRKKAPLDVPVQELIDTGAERKLCCPWAFPIFASQKEGGTTHLCVDFRELNAITLRDSYCFLSVDSILSHLGTASVFTTLNYSRRFLRIPIREKDIPKTLVTYCRGFY